MSSVVHASRLEMARMGRIPINDTRRPSWDGKRSGAARSLASKRDAREAPKSSRLGDFEVAVGDLFD
jgi:hypothetical protein